MATSEADIAAQLIERLLGDPAFRTEFRRDPASACRKAGLDELADEMSIGAGKAMMTLDQRESKSSLAGVMMAAAMEGVGIYQFGEHVLPHLDDVPSAVGDVLSRVSLPAIDLKGALAGGPDAPAAAAAGRGRRERRRGAAEAGGAGRRRRAAAARPRRPRRPRRRRPTARGGEGGGGGRRRPRCPPEQAAGRARRRRRSPRPSRRRPRTPRPPRRRSRRSRRRRRTSPTASDLPDSGVAPQQVEEVGPGGEARPDGARPRARHDHAGARPRRGGRAGGAGAAPPADRGRRRAARSARRPVAVRRRGRRRRRRAEALRCSEQEHHPRRRRRQKDIKDGADRPAHRRPCWPSSPRSTRSSSRCICSDHSPVHLGRLGLQPLRRPRVDIAARRRGDRQLRQPGRARARDRDRRRSTGDLRPTEIGSPWAIGGLRLLHRRRRTRTTSTSASRRDRPRLQAARRRRAPAAARRRGRRGAAGAPSPPRPRRASPPPPRPPPPQPKAKPATRCSFRAVTAEDAAEGRPRRATSCRSCSRRPGRRARSRRRAVPRRRGRRRDGDRGRPSSLGAAALETAKGELAKGVHEEGVNTGAEVDQYLKEAGVGPATRGARAS